MDYYLSEELLMIQELARQVADERIRPVAAHHDETGEFPWEIMETLAEMDFFRVYIDEEFGGLGLSS